MRKTIILTDVPCDFFNSRIDVLDVPCLDNAITQHYGEDRTKLPKPRGSEQVRAKEADALEVFDQLPQGFMDHIYSTNKEKYAPAFVFPTAAFDMKPNSAYEVLHKRLQDWKGGKDPTKTFKLTDIQVSYILAFHCTVYALGTGVSIKAIREVVQIEMKVKDKVKSLSFLNSRIDISFTNLLHLLRW